MADTAIFDVDGTLVDTNYQHALAWYRAFRRYDITPAVWRIHRAIGMGGDNLVTAIAGEDVEKAHGDELRAAWTEEFEPMLDEIQPFEGARALIDEVASRGFRLVLASSGQKAHVEHFLDLLGGREVAEPDLVGVALQKVDGASGVMIGDSVWDAVAAGKLDVPTIAVRTGGFSEAELREAGAFRVYESLVELHENLDGGPLARSTR